MRLALPSIRSDRARRPAAILAALILAFVGLVAVPAQPAQADVVSDLVATLDAPSPILAGEDGSFTIEVSNEGGDRFNLGFSALVPVGLTPGAVTTLSGSPVGAPRVVPAGALGAGAPPAGTQLWVWEDVSDLPAGALSGLVVDFSPDANVFPVGATIDIAAEAHTSAQARYRPVFPGSTGVGGSDAVSATQSSGSVETDIKVSALRLEKDQLTYAENELLRGVHEQGAVYRLRVTNTNQGATRDDDVTRLKVVDWLPAGLEFLGCGGVDNTTHDWSGTGDGEYGGAGTLGAGVTAGTDCPDPDLVETVQASAADAERYGVIAGRVYTKVTWSLADLPAGAVRDIHYVAAVPLFENTLDWSNAPDGEAPSVDSGEQGANLDNNTGPSTRHGSPTSHEDGDAWTNAARAQGHYVGEVVQGTDRSVWDSDSETITAMDLAIVKDVDRTSFAHEEYANFTLTVSTSEYASSANVTVTDTIPDGTCLVASTSSTNCLTGPGAVFGDWLVEGITSNSDGSRDVTFRYQPGTIAKNETVKLTYPVLMGVSYQRSGWGPTTAGDHFRNTAEITGTTTLEPGVQDHFPGEGEWQVWDDSWAELTAPVATISKQVLARDALPSDGCSAEVPGSNDWLAGDANDPADGFRLGDTVCYLLTVNFPADVDTRNAVVSDVLPAGIELGGWAVGDGSPQVAQVGEDLVWRIGTVETGTDDRIVLDGSTLHLYVWGTVTLGAVNAVVDKPENLMKYRQENVHGEVFFLRDQAATEILPPPLSLLKGIRDVNGETGRHAQNSASNDGNVFNSNRDGIEVVRGEFVTYRVDLTAEYPVESAVVWDLLPRVLNSLDQTEIEQAVSGLPASAEIVKGSTLGLTDDAERWVIVWNDVAVNDQVGDRFEKTLTYTVRVTPAMAEVGTSHRNDATVVSYAAKTNDGGDTTYYPVDGPAVDGVDPEDRVPAPQGRTTTDPSDVLVENVTVAKGVVSPAGTNNAGSTTPGASTQVAIGEWATYTYAVTIPANTTVISGVLSDALPGQAHFWEIDANRTVVQYPGGVTAPGTVSFTHRGESFGIDTAAGRLTFPEGAYTTEAAETFTVELTARVRPGASWQHSPSTSRQNIASFHSSNQPKGVATAGTIVIEPNPQITKVADAEAGTIRANQEVTYTLTARNQSGRPTSFDTVVVDCVPAGLEVLSTTPAGGVTLDENSADCAGTLITWEIGDLAAQGSTAGTGEVASPRTLEYTVRIDPNAGAGVQYDNTATITGYSVPEEPSNSDPYRRDYQRTDDESISAVRPGIAKTVDGAAGVDAVVGEIVDYEVVVTVPAMINVYDVVVEDVVPAGIEISGTPTVAYAGGAWDSTPPAVTPLVDGQTITLGLGDIESDAAVRTVTITYRGTVTDTSSVRDGTALDNTATLSWNTLNDDDDSRSSEDDEATVTPTEPQLGIVKKVDAPATTPANQDAITVDAGGSFHYRVRVSNTGTSTAHDVAIVDTVPTGVVVDAESISDGGQLTGADPVTGGGTITWSLGSLAAGANHTFTYGATLTGSTTLDGSALENVAEVPEYFSHPGDPSGEDYDNDQRRRYEGPQDEATVTPLFPAPVITKTADPTTTALGDAVAFEVVVTNDGDSPLETYTVVDTLPAGWSVSSLDPAPTQSGTVATGLRLEWTGGPIAVGGSVTFTYEATPDTDHPWTTGDLGLAVDHTNAVRVTGTDGSGSSHHLDRDSGDQVRYEDDTTADVNIPLADLELRKSVLTDDVVAGDPITWGLDVLNHGPDAEAGPVTIVDTVPAGIVAESAADFTVAGLGWTLVSYDSATRELTLSHSGGVGAPSAGIPAMIPRVTVTALIDPGFVPEGAATRPMTNTATVSGTTDELVTDNNDDDARVSVRPSADLELVKDAVTDSYVPGTFVIWEIDVTNHGPSVSRTPFTVTDVLPAEVDPASLELLDGTGWSVAGSPAGQTVTFEYAGADLGVDEATSTLRYQARVRSNVQSTDPIVNEATVHPTTPDDDPSNNDDDTPVNHDRALADLSLTKALASEDLVAGEGGRYRLEVANAGPSYAVGVVVTDTLPAGLSYAGSLESLDGSWILGDEVDNPDGTSTLTFELTSDSGMLPDGASTWLEFDVDVASWVTDEVTNVAEVGSSTPDDDPSNNEDDESSDPVVETNLSITKEHEDAVRRVGDTVTFTITVTNHGPADAADVALRDALPAGLTFEDVTDVFTATDGREWTVTVADDELTAALDGTLPAGETAVVEITARLTPASFPNVTNRVTVDTSTPESSKEDNVDDDGVPVDSPDLRVVKAAAAESVQGGDELTYTITVTNHGGAHADEVTLTDTLPDELEYLTSAWDSSDPAAAVGEVCVLDGASEAGLGGTLDCVLPEGLAAGQSATLVVTLAVPADIAVDSVTNTVTVASDDEEPSLRDDNDDEETTPVRWIRVVANAACVLEAPWLDFTVDLHNVAAGESLVLEWYADADADGDGRPDGRPIHSETVGTAAGDLISGRVLWPGAEVDEDGIATALPGYRPAKHGETATWQHMVEDESLPEHALRGDVILRFTINPERSAAVSYVAITPDCLAERDTVLEITKTADAERVDAGDTLTYTIEVRNTGNGAARDVVVTDQIPAELKVEKVTTAKPESRQLMPWQECTVRGQDERGYGGTVTCELDGVLARGQTAPPITIVTTVDPEADSGDVLNVAQVEWTSADGDEEDGVAEDDAEVELRGDEDLAVTGAEILRLLGIAAVLVLGGALLVLVVRARRA